MAVGSKTVAVLAAGCWLAVTAGQQHLEGAGCHGDPSCAAGDETGLLQKMAVQERAVATDGADGAQKEKFWFAPPARQMVVEFAKYFSYTGHLKVSGSMSVDGTGLLKSAAQTIGWNLYGVDPACWTVPSGVKNACGIHIHKGQSCYADAEGHYWNNTLIPDDPWATVTYNSFGLWTLGTAKVITGLTNYQVLNHTMIVHDSTGARIACGIIIPAMLQVPAMTPYFSYTGNLKVSGGADVYGFGVTNTAGQYLKWSFTGVDPQCKNGASNTPNSCGVHIHQGMNCSGNALGHYWNKTTFGTDPWATVNYKADMSWNGKFVTVSHDAVVTGFENTIVNGHTMIVHDYTGGRISCGIIAPHKEVTNAFVKYFSYTGDLEVSGFITVRGSGVLDEAAQELGWSLNGVDPACSTPPAPDANPNACGIHIHVGMDCTSDAGGHYFAVSSDPWTAVKYTATPFGATFTWKDVKVVTGLTNYQVLGHTMIVHDSTGARIACGIVNYAAEYF